MPPPTTPSPQTDHNRNQACAGAPSPLSAGSPHGKHIRECACGRGLQCVGMTQAFRLLGDPRCHYVELPRFKKDPPAYKYVFRNNLRAAYLRHLSKGNSNFDISEFESTKRRYVALHHFHPTVVRAFYENPLTSAQKHKVPISITEHEMQELGMDYDEKDKILSMTGKPTGGYYFVPSYQHERAHQDLKELIHAERKAKEIQRNIETLTQLRKRLELKKINDAKEGFHPSVPTNIEISKRDQLAVAQTDESTGKHIASTELENSSEEILKPRPMQSDLDYDSSEEIVQPKPTRDDNAELDMIIASSVDQTFDDLWGEDEVPSESKKLEPTNAPTLNKNTEKEIDEGPIFEREGESSDLEPTVEDSTIENPSLDAQKLKDEVKPPLQLQSMLSEVDRPTLAPLATERVASDANESMESGVEDEAISPARSRAETVERIVDEIRYKGPVDLDDLYETTFASKSLTSELEVETRQTMEPSGGSELPLHEGTSDTPILDNVIFSEHQVLESAEVSETVALLSNEVSHLKQADTPLQSEILAEFKETSTVITNEAVIRETPYTPPQPGSADTTSIEISPVSTRDESVAKYGEDALSKTMIKVGAESLEETISTIVAEQDLANAKEGDVLPVNGGGAGSLGDDVAKASRNNFGDEAIEVKVVLSKEVSRVQAKEADLSDENRKGDEGTSQIQQSAQSSSVMSDREAQTLQLGDADDKIFGARLTGTDGVNVVEDALKANRVKEISVAEDKTDPG